jgi:hypothetical protein
VLLEWEYVCVDGSEKASRMMMYVAGRTRYNRWGGIVSMTNVFAYLFVIGTVTRL